MSDTSMIDSSAAEAASAQQDWPEAIRLWTAVLEQQPLPGLPQTRVKLLDALSRLERWTEVENLLAPGLVDAPAHPGLLRIAAQAAGKRQDWPEASRRWAQCFSALRKLPPKRLRAEALSAACRADDLEEARRLLSLATAKPVSDAEAEDLRAEIGGHELRIRAGFPSGDRAAPAQISVQEVCQAFWEVESRLELLQWRVGSVAPWPLLRLNAYYRLTQSVGLYDPPHPGLKAKLGHEVEGAKSLLETLPGRDTLMISATKKMNGSEPYSDAVRHALGDRAVVMDRPIDGEILLGAIDFDAVLATYRDRFAEPGDRYLSAEDRFRIHELQEMFRREIGVAPPEMVRSARHNLGQFRSAYRGFSELFSNHEFARVIVTNGYGVILRAVIEAARDAGIATVELQHGFISPFHLGYSWPGRPVVPHAPDELWTFGSFWGETTPLPGQTKARVIGAPYVADKARDAPSRDPRLVVFTSQGVIGRRLFGMALETARRRPDKRVVFRLHPNESLADFQALAPADAPDNFSLSAGVPNIFALLAEAEIQVGAFSTTLLEGMSLGTRTIVLDLPGIEYMSPVIRRGDALFVRTTEDLIEKLDSAPLAKDPEAYYAAPQSLEDLRRTD